MRAHTHTHTHTVISISLVGFVADQMCYDLESAMYDRDILYI